MNNTEIIATDAGVADFARSSAPLSSYTAPNVDATIEAKAATTRISVRSVSYTHLTLPTT